MPTMARAPVCFARTMPIKFPPSFTTTNRTPAAVAATTFSDTAARASTTCFYVVEGVDPAGSSAPSTQAMVTTGPPITNIAINSGGPAASPFLADEDFTGGSTINHANTIDLSGVTNPAPMAVYQTARIGNYSYSIPGFGPGSSQKVRLHFAETFFTTAGSRTLNVTINGTQGLTNFEHFAAAAAANKAVIKEFTLNADSSGMYTITTASEVNSALISGIETVPGVNNCTTVPTPPRGLGPPAVSRSHINFRRPARTH